MKLSELLTNAGVSFGIPEGMSELEVKTAENVCNFSFYPWIRATGEEILEKIHEDLDEYIYAHRTICLWVEKDPKQQYAIRLISPDNEEEDWA